MSLLYQVGQEATNRNSLWLQPFLQAPGLPFARVLLEGDVTTAMAAEGVEFGQLEGSVYTPALTVWGWLSQTLHTGELRSCAAAVSRIIVLLVAMGHEPCAEDTSADRRARQKLPEAVIRRLAVQVGEKLEAEVPADWLWHGRHVKLADGTTLTMPDTDANRAAYPQNPAQKPGLGFPILRMVILLSLATGLLYDMAVGPYAGKETGENALLRTLWDALHPGDILLADRLYCSYCQVALCRGGTSIAWCVCTRGVAPTFAAACAWGAVTGWSSGNGPRGRSGWTKRPTPRSRRRCPCGRSSSRSRSPASARRNWWSSRPSWTRIVIPCRTSPNFIIIAGMWSWISAP